MEQSEEWETFFMNEKLFPSSIPDEEVAYLREMLEEDAMCHEWEWFYLLLKMLEQEEKGEEMEEEDLLHLHDLNNLLIEHYAEHMDDGKVEIPKWLAYQTNQMSNWMPNPYEEEDFD